MLRSVSGARAQTPARIHLIWSLIWMREWIVPAESCKHSRRPRKCVARWIRVNSQSDLKRPRRSPPRQRHRHRHRHRQQWRRWRRWRCRYRCLWRGRIGSDQVGCDIIRLQQRYIFFSLFDYLTCFCCIFVFECIISGRHFDFRNGRSVRDFMRR